MTTMRVDIAGWGPGPESAGTAGEAALWGGSSAVVGMAANPFGAHQVGVIHRPGAKRIDQRNQ